MSSIQVFKMFTLLLASLVLLTKVNCQRVAVANLASENVVGSIKFTETDEGLQVSGSIRGLDPGLYGFHIHESGDTTTCTATGSHFNPDENNHAARENATRHVGDLGNVEFVENGTAVTVAVIDFVDAVISLRGRNSILGRALVLHEGEDDLGLGGNETSLTTGNAGGRVACAVIGISSPIEPWDTGNGGNSKRLYTPLLLTLIVMSNLLFAC